MQRGVEALDSLFPILPRDQKKLQIHFGSNKLKWFFNGNWTTLFLGRILPGGTYGICPKISKMLFTSDPFYTSKSVGNYTHWRSELVHNERESWQKWVNFNTYF